MSFDLPNAEISDTAGGQKWWIDNLCKHDSWTVSNIWFFYLPTIAKLLNDLQIICARDVHFRTIFHYCKTALNAQRWNLGGELCFINFLWVFIWEYFIDKHSAVLANRYHVLVSGAEKCIKHPVVMARSTFRFSIVFSIDHDGLLLVAAYANVSPWWRILDIQYFPKWLMDYFTDTFGLQRIFADLFRWSSHYELIS